MPYTDSITSLANESALLVTRRAVSPRIAGRDQPPTITSFTIVASVQPITGRELERLSDGKIDSELFTIYTKTELKIGGGGSGLLPDLISYLMKTLEVEKLEPWDAFGAKYYKAIARAIVS